MASLLVLITLCRRNQTGQASMREVVVEEEAKGGEATGTVAQRFPQPQDSRTLFGAREVKGAHRVKEAVGASVSSTTIIEWDALMVESESEL